MVKVYDFVNLTIIFISWHYPFKLYLLKEKNEVLRIFPFSQLVGEQMPRLA
jgi:hypothetical protein